jgi:soluble lytic murein transglycosylase-like protein
LKRPLFIAFAVSLLCGASAVAQTSGAVLSTADVQRYRQIFSDERDGHFDDAQSLVSQLSDRSLVGYAQAEHYLSPHSAKTPVGDLVSWMNEYNDLPIAQRIHDLAVERATKKIKRHHKVVRTELTADIPPVAAPPRRVGGGYEDADLGDLPLASDIARNAMPQILAAVKADQPAQADTILQATVAQNIPGSDVARLSQKVAASYLAEGQDFNAFDVQGRVGTDRITAPGLDWIAGLSAYRMGKFDVAAQHFEALAQIGSIPSWTRSQAAFWAARAYMRNNDPRRVITLLIAASKEEPTFYGLLAERVLGWDTKQAFADPVVQPADFDALMQNPCAHRAVALWQIGETQDIHTELDRALAQDNSRHSETIAALARQTNQPDIELRASEISASHGQTLTGLFPMPDYSPPGGYRVDPSLLFAFARQESRFRTADTSHAGAHGLMQIMPGTAALVEGNDVSRAEMNDPNRSLDLGQKVLVDLIAKMNGNLFEVTAAYDSGPGNVWRWADRPGTDKNDPLLFIESIPSPETRNYVKRVMTYYWMYNRRENQAPVTLDAAARGDWPKYQRTVPAYAQPVQPQPQQPADNTRISDASTPH